MIKNYFIIVWRNLWRNKLYSSINIFGLGIGISCCALIFLFVQNELSYDNYNEKADRIYRLTSILRQAKDDHYAGTPPVAAPKIQSVFPEVEKIVRLSFEWRPLVYNHEKFYGRKVLYADSTLLDIFTMPLLEGDPKKALTTPYSIIITNKIAKKYFGNKPALGKILTLGDTTQLMITGVMKDIPPNSHIDFDCIISRSTLIAMNKNIPGWYATNEKEWIDFNTYSYVLLKNKVDVKAFEEKINKFLDKETAHYKKDIGMWVNMEVQPLRDIHLRSHLEYEFPDGKNSDINYVYIFSATALLILLIACCNFINLSTARSLNRSKEIGLRKVIGAKRSQLVFQFLSESLSFSLIACLLSVLLVMFFLPFFNSFTGKQLVLDMNAIWLYLVVVCSVGFMAGLYPALLMSSFSPIRSLKGKVSHGFADIFFRKGLVVFQFSIAIVLIIMTTLIFQQLEFIQNKNIGLNKEKVLTIGIGYLGEKSKVLIDELKKNPKVVSISRNNFSFNGIPNLTVWPEGFAQNEKFGCPVIAVDEDFFKTMQIEVIAGRNFSKDFLTDENEAFIVNEAAVKEFRLKNPKEAIGKKLSWEFDFTKKGKIIGVVKNFNFSSMKENVRPLLIHVFPRWFWLLSVRLKTNDLTATMKEIKTNWKNVAGDLPFDYAFLEDDFNALYKSEHNMRSVLSVFTSLSVLVSCLSLFGLAAFTIKQRFKEIGIRKVLGSSVTNIVQLLSKDFLKLVLISIVIASPIAWYAMHKWLQDFAYRVDISWWVFLVAGLLAIVIAFVTVCVQAIKAALANPVKSIRTE